MEKTVKLLGLVAAGSVVTVGGPQGPETHAPAHDCPIAAFALPGWRAGDATDEAHGHAALRDMEAVGQVRADGQVTAAEFGSLVARLELPGGELVEVTVPIAEELIRRVQDDGKLSRADQLAVGRAALGALVRHFLG